MVKLRTALKNKVNNICSANGVNLNRESLASEKGLRAVGQMPFEPLVQLELKIIVDQIRSLNQSIAELEKIIGDEGQKLDGHKNLTSIKGIGKLSGGILLSIIGDIGDFADEGKLAAYFGIVPRVSNSNETEHSEFAASVRDAGEPALLSSFSRRGAADHEGQSQTTHSRANRAVATPVGSVP
jgi:transposase